MGKNCKKLYNPNQYSELQPVNSAVCEQHFRITNHYSNFKSMKEQRIQHFFIYTIDIHNHHSIGDIKHAVNPTSRFRMEMILQAALEDKKVASADDLADQLVSLNLDPDDRVTCSCTRKCKTKQCPCLAAGIRCKPNMCHPSNNSCTNL